MAGSSPYAHNNGWHQRPEPPSRVWCELIQIAVQLSGHQCSEGAIRLIAGRRHCRMSLFVRNLDVQCRKHHQSRKRAVIAGIAYSGQWQIVVLALANEIVHWGNVKITRVIIVKMC